MAFNLDTNKSVIILSHPRSGSTWIQDSLPHFNLSELFTMYCGIKQVDMDTGIKYNYSNTANNDLEYRFELFDKFVERHKAVSVKTHLHLLTEPLCKFFEQRDLQYVFLERKNKRDTFWSLLIALNTLEFHNTITKKNIVIPTHSIDDALQIMKEYYNKMDMIRIRFNPIEIYYEDMLTLPETSWWKPSTKYVVQNAKEVITIENINEVTDYLNKISAPSEYI
jgi:hypothetical protein